MNARNKKEYKKAWSQHANELFKLALAVDDIELSREIQNMIDRIKTIADVAAEKQDFEGIE